MAHDLFLTLFLYYNFCCCSMFTVKARTPFHSNGGTFSVFAYQSKSNLTPRAALFLEDIQTISERISLLEYCHKRGWGKLLQFHSPSDLFGSRNSTEGINNIFLTLEDLRERRNERTGFSLEGKKKPRKPSREERSSRP